MIYINPLILTTIIILNISSLFACNNNIYSLTNHDLHKKYIFAKKKLKNNNYKIAIKELKKLNKQHPYNNYSDQISLDLIYAYYKSMDHFLTLKTINDFIKSNPKHPNIDYPLYMQGLTNMELDNNNLSNKLFKSNHRKKNPSYAYAAFHNFLKLINQYPNSPYILDSYKRLIYLKNRIAEYELSIIKYYYKKKAYIAVINRSEEMLQYFSDTQATRHALKYMYISYQKLKLTEQSNKVMKIITYKTY